MTFNLKYDAAALAAPASFRAGIEQAASLLSAALSDKITVNVSIHYAGTGGGAFAGPDAAAFDSYSDVRTHLVNGASPFDKIFLTLPTGSSIQSQSSVRLTSAQMKVFGLLDATAAADDGSATFATDIDPNLLVGVALHELTHALGRIPDGPAPDIFDLFRFTSAGVRLFNGHVNRAPAAYFSIDGGITDLADYGRRSDTSDFLNGGVQGPVDPFNEFYSDTTLQQLTPVDLQQMDALGFHLSSARQLLAIAGTVANQAGQDNQTSKPFASVQFTGSFPTSAETVSITLLDGSNTASDANGALSGSGLSKTGTGKYQLSGTPDVVTSEIEQLIFAPTANEVAPGSTVTTTFGLVLAEGADSIGNNGASIVVTSVNDPPQITGALGGQTTTDKSTIKPFSGVTIGDVDRPAQSETLTVQLDDPAKGTLSNAAGGTYDPAAGRYSATGTAAALTTLIDGLVFTPTANRVPPGNSETTSFTITVNDGFGPVSNAITSVVTSATGAAVLAEPGAQLAMLSPAQIAALPGQGIVRIDATDDVLTLNVAQALALGTVSLTPADTVTLLDTGAHLKALTAAQIAGLAYGVDVLDASDNAQTLSVAQVQALGPIVCAAGDVVTLADTGANLAGLSVASIAGLASHGIDRIDATDNGLSLNVAQYLALGPVVSAPADLVTLADSGANLAGLSVASISALAGHGIDRIDATDNALSLGLAQFNALGGTTLAASDALTLAGTPDNDAIAFANQPFSAHDRIDGGAGTDTITLAGDFSAGLAFEAGTIANIERIVLSGGNSYKLTLADANVAAGQTLIVNGARLGAGNTLVVDGSAETDGKLNFVGGAGSNTFTGGNGADLITAGSGPDLVRYTSALQSTSAAYDTVAGFDASQDKFSVWSGVSGIDASITGGKLSGASFDIDLAAAANAAHLLANHAALFAPNAGTLAGTQFLVVDTNGVAGYQAGSDLAIRLNAATNLGAFGTANFA